MTHARDALQSYDNPLADTKLWFEKAVPTPQVKNFTTQLGCHFEEVAEMIACLTPISNEMLGVIVDAKIAVQHLADQLKQHGGVYVEDNDRAELLDAICDQVVTGVGVAHMVGDDVVGALGEVNRSNFSKFDPCTGEPIFDANMKVTKGPAYTKADITRFTGAKRFNGAEALSAMGTRIAV